MRAVVWHGSGRSWTRVISCGWCDQCSTQMYSQCSTTQNTSVRRGASLFGYTKVYSQVPGALYAYDIFQKKEDGCIKVILEP